MPLFRPRDFIVALLSLIAGNIHLSAFDIPVELPSGSTIHLNTKYLYVNPIEYAVYINTTINDPEELFLFVKDPLDVISQSLFIWNTMITNICAGFIEIFSTTKMNKIEAFFQRVGI